MEFNEICDFEQKSALCNSHELTYPHPFLRLGAHGTQKVQILLKSRFWAQNTFLVSKSDFDPKSGILSKNDFLRPHVADAYKPNGFLSKMEAIFAQSRFLSQKCVLDPKIDFWAKKSKNRPKRRLWAQKCAFSQKWPKS